MNPLVITILAAGEGKRMNSNIPKVLHLFQGKPMIVRILETALTLESKKIIVVTGKYNDLIQDTISQYMDIPAEKIYFVVQSVPCGTGDAIKQCLSSYEHGDKVLILNGDMPLITRDILNRFIESGMDATILVARFENPKGYGRIMYDDHCNFIKIVEEKDCDDQERKVDIINSGIYLIQSDMLKKFIPKIQNKNSQQEYYLTDIVKMIASDSEKKINTYLIHESENKYICGVNTQEELHGLLTS